ncbi:hypothetical protein [Emticicia fontis]
MFKRFTYLILFLSLSGLLFANEQKAASLKPSKGIRKTTANKEKNIPPSADDYISIDFNTNYYIVRGAHDKQGDYGYISTDKYLFLNENTLLDLFVQKTLSFFKSECIYLLNCIWLI